MKAAAQACVLGLPGWSFLSADPPDPGDPVDVALMFELLNQTRREDERRVEWFANMVANQVAKRFS